ncbi:Uncharacterized protein At2g29880 [Linum perenne]
MDESENAGGSKCRDYKAWTPELDAILIDCMLHLVKNNEATNGNFKNGGFKKLEEMMHKKMPNCGLKVFPHIKSRHRFFKKKYGAICEIKAGSCSGFGWDDQKGRVVADDDVFAGFVKTHPHFSGLNKKAFMYFPQLAMIFGKDRAMGEDAIAAGDADIDTGARVTATPTEDNDAEVPAATDIDMHSAEVAAGYTNMVFDEATSQHFLEQMINEGVDGRTYLNVESKGRAKTSSASASSKRTKMDKSETYISEVGSEISKFHPLMEQASVNIERIANNFQQDSDLTSRRANLYNELSMIDGLSHDQVLSAAIVLMKDVCMAQLYYQLPSDEEKLEFLLRIIN